MSEELDKSIEILSKSILVPTKIRTILRQIIATTENQKDTCRQQQQQQQHQDIRCGMVPLISTTTTLVELSPNEEDNESEIIPHARRDLFKPPKKCIAHDTMLPPPQPRRSVTKPRFSTLWMILPFLRD